MKKFEKVNTLTVTVRGGSWRYLDTYYLRACHHNKYGPYYKNYDLGFRCVSSVGSETAKRFIKIA